jgi:transposase
MKIEVTETELIDNHGTRTFRVKDAGDEEWKAVEVWLTGMRPACTQCSGPLSAMLATCRHSKAVIRFVKKRPYPQPRRPNNVRTK